jgi:hypothetical protein
MSCSDAFGDAETGRYSVKTLQRQVHFDIIISMGIFILTQVGSAIVTPFWRPVGYAIGWAVLGFLIAILGLIGVRKKSSALLIMFSVLLVMLACLNISHVLTMRSEHVHTCRLNQRTFRDCDAEPSLRTCLTNNQCNRDQIMATKCKAPGHEHCDELDKMNYVFIANMLISFLTFAEPTFWSMLLLIRMEMTFPITPDEDDMDEDETAKPDGENTPLMSPDGGVSSAPGTGTGSGTGQTSTLRWI